MSKFSQRDWTSYEKLVEMVKDLDDEAYEYMVKEVPLRNDFVPSDDLALCFEWANSPQGVGFWCDLWAYLD